MKRLLLNWSPTLIIVLIIAHIVALVFGLAGLLIAVPNPHLWADSEMGVRVYQFGMQYAGGVHIVFAAGAMLVAGIYFIGARKTLIFFAVACVISLSAELIGTTTGFPFGEYRYTSGLGYKILGEVPFTIPLSWFYMGLASYMLAIVLAGTSPGWRRPAASVVLGAALLTIWDLVLDPAMAHQALDVRFWVWDQGGYYFGMPAQNFLGWMLTGTLFIGISRLLWQAEPAISTGVIRASYVVYIANLIFAMVISGAVGLWEPIVITLIIGVVPATLALILSEGSSSGRSREIELASEPTVQRVSRGFMTSFAKLAIAREADVRVEGESNVPSQGPVLIISNHYHHLLDGCALLASSPRDIHIVAAVDWAGAGLKRRLLELGCRMARWPMVVRPDSSGGDSIREARNPAILRQALRDAVALLSEGRALVVFPEGYPTIDPHGSRKENGDTLDFQSGFATIARAAQRRTGYEIPIVPTGFNYQQSANGGWDITLRFGAPIYLRNYDRPSDLIHAVQSRVEALASPAMESISSESSRVTETT
jgi:uncharacterized membrane protein/1-acyl-sn-glycerol-3-phosphate acyltransferase